MNLFTDYEENLNIHKKFLEEILEASEVSSFEWIKKINTVSFSEKMKQKFDIKCEIDNYKGDLAESIYVFEDDRESFETAIEKNKLGKKFSKINCRIKNKYGEYVWCRISLVSIFDDLGSVEALVGTIEDVDKETKIYKDLKYKAEYDSLTGVRNFNKFCDDTKSLLKANPNKNYAIISMDIDKFGIINDLYGVENGNNVLRQLAIIFQRTLSSLVIYCRLYGDMFVICMNYDKVSDIEAVIKKIAKEIEKSKFIMEITPSFGVYIIDDKDSPVSVMCDRASIVKRTVKGNLEKKYAFYDSEFRNRLINERNMEKELQPSLEAHKFTMYLQPKYNMITGEIVGAEALARWDIEKNKCLYPKDFIPLFEKNGSILKLDEYIWEEACRTIKKWLASGLKSVPISVNVSRLHIYNPNFTDMLVWLTQKYEIPKELLVLELKENLFFDENENVERVLNKLKNIGFSLEMDNFGLGYSSLNMLKNIYIDTVKLDKNFIKNLENERERVVVKHAVALANELELKVVAEGVETEEQMQFLLKCGCNVAQGFYFATPLTIDQFEYKAFYKIKGNE